MKKIRLLALSLALLFHCSLITTFAEEEEAEITGQGHISINEEIDDKIDEDNDSTVVANPSTGDYSNALYWYLGIFITSSFFLIFLVSKRRKKHN